MARVIVFTEDLGNEESLKRGYVVDILPDGQFAGTCIENGVDVNGSIKYYWRIMEMPGVPPADLEYLMERDFKAPDSIDIVPLRKHKLNLDVLEEVHAVKNGVLSSTDKIVSTKEDMDHSITLETTKDAGIILPAVKG